MVDEISSPGYDRINAAADALQVKNNVVPIVDSGAESSVTEEIETAAILAPLIHLTFDIIAPNWKITDAENMQLSEAYAGIIDKYFPDGDMFEKFGAEFAAISVTAMIIIPRIKVPRKNKVKKPVKSVTENPEIKMEKAA